MARIHPLRALGLHLVAGVVIAGLALPASAGGAVCREPALTSAAGTQVDLRASCFAPAVVRIAQGATVTFTNHDVYPHTVTGVGNTFGDFDELGEGDAVSFVFERSGVFPYYCALHPSMVGAVVVGDGGPATERVAGLPGREPLGAVIGLVFTALLATAVVLLRRRRLT